MQTHRNITINISCAAPYIRIYEEHSLTILLILLGKYQISDDKLTTNLPLYGDNIHSVEVNASILKNTLSFFK